MIFTHEGLPGVSGGQSLSLYKDTSPCCFVKFISASRLPFSLLKPIANCPQCCDGGARYFACVRGQHFLPGFFQSSAGYFAGCLSLSHCTAPKNSYKDQALTSKSCASSSSWLRGPHHSSWLHPGLVWVIVPGKERGSGCQLQLGVWMNNKEIYKTSWNKGPGSLPATLSPFTHWLDHTSYITVSGLPCQWKQCTMMLECCFQRWKIQQIAFVYSIHCCYAGKL